MTKVTMEVKLIFLKKKSSVCSIQQNPLEQHIFLCFKQAFTYKVKQVFG